ncbi:MAG: outer membrane protein assembly factor BamC [Gallionellaceae bacterium]|nr:outer membrane protein assembly factor BamC [Gallionellaceae bacterium]
MPLLLLVLAGCGSMGGDGKKVDYKAATVKLPPLEVPPDLTTPGTEDLYVIPEGGSETVTSYSDYAKSGVLPQASRAVAVLPEPKNVRMERNGAQRWLVVDDRAENVWPLIKAFWQEKGFNIKVDNPQAGILETDWAENRANIPKEGLRSVIGKVFDSLYDSGKRDMYRIRLERVKNGGSTEIHITHYGKEEFLDKDGVAPKWRSAPGDPEMEVAMLQMLMAKLGGAEGAQVAAKEAAAPAGEAADAPKLQELAGGGKAIFLNDSFDKSWRKVGLALERAGIPVEDKDRTSGVYYLRLSEGAPEKNFFSKLAFWSKEDGDKAPRYQVTVQESGAGCQVVASYGKGEHNSTTLRVIDALYNNIGK